jgi:hypothetical protein
MDLPENTSNLSLPRPHAKSCPKERTCWSGYDLTLLVRTTWKKKKRSSGREWPAGYYVCTYICRAWGSPYRTSASTGRAHARPGRRRTYTDEDDETTDIPPSASMGKSEKSGRR